jgi:hypothetical protein
MPVRVFPANILERRRGPLPVTPASGMLIPPNPPAGPWDECLQALPGSLCRPVLEPRPSSIEQLGKLGKLIHLGMLGMIQDSGGQECR